MLVIRFAITIVLLSIAARGTKPSVHFEHLSIDDGLPQNSTTALLLDSKAFIWVGTQTELV